MKVKLVVLVMVGMLLSGCFWNNQVEANEVGLILKDGASISQVVGPGRYSDWGWFAKMVVVDTAAKTITWDDPDLVTNDKQPIGLNVGITYARMGDSESAELMYSQYNSEARSDDALALQVLNRIPRIAKEITARYTLDEMLGVAENSEFGRTSITKDLFELLAPELVEVKIRLLDVGINNISPSADYLSLLQDKANAQVAIEVARERTKELDEQLAQEKSQTNIETERARRQNLVNAELAKTYELSPQFYELERLKLLKDVIGSNDKIYFVPQGVPLSLVLTGDALGETPIFNPGQ